jgi:hypothetical protein
LARRSASSSPSARYFDIPLSGMLLYAPDAAWLLLINGIVAIVSIVMTIGVTVFMVRRYTPSETVVSETEDPAES